MVFGCVCIFIILMCTFFVDSADAVTTICKGTTTKKEETIEMNLSKGTCLVTVSDTDSWVYAQLQKTGGNQIGEALAGEKLLAPLGQEKTFAVRVKKAGTLYLYLHGTNAGASYQVRMVAPGGTLKSGTPLTGTSYGDNTTVVWYKMKVADSGSLKVTVKDSSYRYPGYSKVQLKKNDAVISGDEHLIGGLDYSTVYGVSKGTYYIGVRSSSEIYNITAEFTKLKQAKYGKTKKQSEVIKRKKKAYGIIEPGDATARWYRIDIPDKSSGEATRTIRIQAQNSNVNTSGGVAVRLHYKRVSNGEYFSEKEEYLLNNSEQELTFKAFKDKVRTVYVRMASASDASGAYMIYWK